MFPVSLTPPPKSSSCHTGQTEESSPMPSNQFESTSYLHWPKRHHSLPKLKHKQKCNREYKPFSELTHQRCDSAPPDFPTWASGETTTTTATSLSPRPQLAPKAPPFPSRGTATAALLLRINSAPTRRGLRRGTSDVRPTVRSFGALYDLYNAHSPHFRSDTSAAGLTIRKTERVLRSERKWGSERQHDLDQALDGERDRSRLRRRIRLADVNTSLSSLHLVANGPTGVDEFAIVSSARAKTVPQVQHKSNPRGKKRVKSRPLSVPRFKELIQGAIFVTNAIPPFVPITRRATHIDSLPVMILTVDPEWLSELRSRHHKTAAEKERDRYRLRIRQRSLTASLKTTGGSGVACSSLALGVQVCDESVDECTVGMHFKSASEGHGKEVKTMSASSALLGRKSESSSLGFQHPQRSSTGTGHRSTASACGHDPPSDAGASGESGRRPRHQPVQISSPKSLESQARAGSRREAEGRRQGSTSHCRPHATRAPPEDGKSNDPAWELISPHRLPPPPCPEVVNSRRVTFSDTLEEIPPAPRWRLGLQGLHRLLNRNTPAPRSVPHHRDCPPAKSAMKDGCQVAQPAVGYGNEELSWLCIADSLKPGRRHKLNPRRNSF